MLPARYTSSTRTRKGAVIALIAGILAMTAAMMGANMIITPIFMGVPRSVVWDLTPFIGEHSTSSRQV